MSGLGRRSARCTGSFTGERYGSEAPAPTRLQAVFDKAGFHGISAAVLVSGVSLGYEPPRATLHRAVQDLASEDVIVVVEHSLGRKRDELPQDPEIRRSDRFGRRDVRHTDADRRTARETRASFPETQKTGREAERRLAGPKTQAVKHKGKPERRKEMP